VSGEPSGAELVLLADDESGRVSAYLETLRRLPADPRWVLVGGLAVSARVGRTHRATNDVDTVSPEQERLVEFLLELPGAESISAAKVQLDDPAVEVDVMDSTELKELPIGERDRAFALARRFAMSSATDLTIAAVDRAGKIRLRATAPVASRAGLICLKTVSFPNRVTGSYRAKAGSDIQDLCRLVEGTDLDELAERIAASGGELTASSARNSGTTSLLGPPTFATPTRGCAQWRGTSIPSGSPRTCFR
jgi:hypothetical protein